MASIHYEELQCSNDVFSSPFPSSPEQVAVFSPGSSSGSDDEYYLHQYPGYYFEPYEQHELQGKLSSAMANRQKRRAGTSAVPMGNPRLVKGDYAAINAVSYPNHFGHISEACYPIDSSMSSGLSLESFAPLDMSSSTPSMMGYPATPRGELVPGTYLPAAAPASAAPSRGKSTTPNLALLFSLFDVLEPTPIEEACSPLLHHGPSSPLSLQHGRELRSPVAQVPELPSPSATKALFYPAATRQFDAPYHWTQEQEEAGLADYSY